MTVTRQSAGVRAGRPQALDGRSIGTCRQLCYPCSFGVERQMKPDRSIGVAGAGSIGCFVGGMLAASGRRVTLLARPRLLVEIEVNGLRLTNFAGAEQRLAANAITVSDDPSIFRQAGVVLVTVKSADTPQMADIIPRHARQDAVVGSLQNGVGNVAVL